MGRRDGTIAARRRPVSHLFSRSVAPIVPVLRPLFRFQKIWPLKRASVEKHNRTHIFEKIGENGKRINPYSYPYPIYPPISRHVQRSRLDTFMPYVSFFFSALRRDAPYETCGDGERVRLSKLSHPILIFHAPTLCGFDTGNARRRKK